MAMKRWRCPNCGSGKLAPGRARKDDTRRYCLPCSERTGRLVERACPALDARRDAKATARKETTQRVKGRERERLTKRAVVEGLDVREEWKRLCSLGVVRLRLRDQGRRSIPLTIGRTALKGHTTGHAYYAGPVHVTLPEGCTRGQAAAILAHELAHSVASHHAEHHGEGWRRTFALILADGYGVKVADVKAGQTWRLHQHVEDLLHEKEGRTVTRVEAA